MVDFDDIDPVWIGNEDSSELRSMVSRCGAMSHESVAGQVNDWLNQMPRW